MGGREGVLVLSTLASSLFAYPFEALTSDCSTKKGPSSQKRPWPGMTDRCYSAGYRLCGSGPVFARNLTRSTAAGGLLKYIISPWGEVTGFGQGEHSSDY